MLCNIYLHLYGYSGIAPELSTGNVLRDKHHESPRGKPSFSQNFKG